MVFVTGPGVAIAATLAAGIAGSAVASHLADKKLEQLTDQATSVDDLLARSPKSYAINYSEISSVKMSRTALPIGYSRMKIRSRDRNVSFAFKRKMFDQVVRVLRATLPPGATPA
jgi:hypothetical protein